MPNDKPKPDGLDVVTNCNHLQSVGGGLECFINFAINGFIETSNEYNKSKNKPIYDKMIVYYHKFLKQQIQQWHEQKLEGYCANRCGVKESK